MRMTVFFVAVAVSVGAVHPAPVDSRTVAVQVRLDRAGFSPGEIDGKRGGNLKRALAAFQSAEGLPASGAVDDKTVQRLEARTGGQPPLTTYTITRQDVEGPFTPNIPDDLVEQATLRALDYRTPLEALGERFYASPLPPGPDNPVGTVWIDLSKEHYGSHGTPDPSRIGHVESHGCVRLTNWDAQRVAAVVRPGTRVIFR